MTTSMTLKLPERLKHRIASLAKSVGKTPHIWMVEALETYTVLTENRKTLVAGALATEKEVERTGKAYPAAEAHRYLRARVAGRKVKRPKPTRW